MIAIDNLTFSYSKNRTPALIGISAQIPPGIHLLAGENGAGKTTLLHLLAGVSAPTSGSIRINGINPASDAPQQKGHTFLMEENEAFPMKTIKEFAALHSRFYPSFSHLRFCDNLNAFRLTGDEPVKSLSLGNRKKAQLAYVLALGVDTILLDEPTNGLDIESKSVLRTLIATNISPEQTLIVSTHTVSELENLFDGAIMLMGGTLVWAGTEEEMAEQLAFEKSRYIDEDALYAESGMGSALNILPAIEGEPTKVDWRLFYSAIHSPKGPKLIDYLKK